MAGGVHDGRNIKKRRRTLLRRRRIGTVLSCFPFRLIESDVWDLHQDPLISQLYVVLNKIAGEEIRYDGRERNTI